MLYGLVLTRLLVLCYLLYELLLHHPPPQLTHVTPPQLTHVRAVPFRLSNPHEACDRQTHTDTKTDTIPRERLCVCVRERE